MTTAKALGGGLPIGALITGERLREVLQPGDHGSTFAGGPLVAAAANAALDVLEDPALHARVRELGERLREALADLPGVTAVRGRGLMVAFDLDGVSGPDLVKRALLEQRLVVNATGPQTVRLLPPLIVGEARDRRRGRPPPRLPAGTALASSERRPRPCRAPGTGWPASCPRTRGSAARETVAISFIVSWPRRPRRSRARDLAAGDVVAAGRVRAAEHDLGARASRAGASCAAARRRWCAASSTPG